MRRFTTMRKSFRPLVAIILVLTMMCSLAACGSAPSKESFEKVFDNKVAAITGDISEYYATLGDNDPQNMRVDGKFSVQLSDSLVSILEDLSDYDYDLEWINDLEISFSENFKEDVMSFVMGLSHNKTDLVSLEYIMDLASGEMFMNLPGMSEMFVTADMAETSGYDSAEFEALSEVFKSLDMQTMLPEKALNGFLTEIVSTAVKSIEEVTFEETELEANGVSQACVAYTAEISEKNAAEIALAALTMLKESENFETLVTSYVSALNDMSVYVDDLDSFDDADEAYDTLMEEIDSAIESVEEAIDDDDFDEDFLITWTTYITKKKDIIGIEIDIEDEESYIDTTVCLLTARNKNDVGVEAYVKDSGEKLFELEGDLTDDGKKLSGTYELSVEGESMLIVELDGIDVKKLDEGLFLGSINLSPSKDLANMITDEMDLSVIGLSLSKLSIQIDVPENDGKKSKMSLSLMNGDEAFVSFVIDGEISDGADVKLPKDATDDPGEWVEGIDFDGFIEKVQDSDLPEYIVEYVEMLEYLLP